ncbi:epoxide hydrolase [Rhodococcus olei]|uniref:Epoxide hydrolase n=1 Tax=Rhodococcus olei TaxID=2161675 RepID=A0ABP8PQI7_9NOCA
MLEQLQIEQFQVAVPDDVLADLRRRLAQTRWPDQVPGAGWDYGANLEYLQALCRYWETEYDWRATEEALNAWPQFVTTIDEQRIHFLHARSPEPNARPLILTHGWPSSVVEFLNVLGPLTDPVAHGGRAADAFHIVVPSLPGYGWSGPTTTSGWHTGRIAAAFLDLMHQLGYSRFAAHGGDWGSVICGEMGRQSPDRVLGLHLTFLVTAGLQPADGAPTDEELTLMAAQERYNATEQGYVALQATKPQSLAFGLNDSPAGLAAWIVEKLQTWTDHGGDLESALNKDQILGNITTYWVTGTVGSAARLYYEEAHAGRLGPAERVGVPTSVAVYPKELNRTSRRIAEHQYNIERWTNMPRGGHFPAAEQPDLFVAHIRESFRAT